MSNEMVERVARAMWRHSGFDGYWDPATFPSQQHWLGKARAAIEAMRDPTEGMLEAGYWLIDENGVRRVWAKMIDAALEDKP